MIAAVSTMAVVLALAGLVLLSVLRSSLLDNARELAQQHRDTVVEQIRENDSSDVAGDIQGSGTQITQILRKDGTVIASSDDSVEEALYDGTSLAPGETYVSENPGVLGILDFDDYLVAAQGVRIPAGDAVVVVAVPTTIERDAVSTVGWFLIGGVPVLLALAGTLIWFLVGRALRPVERIRTTVAGISHHHLDERVEVPHTRDEIERLAATMNEMLARLESADETQRRFVTDASHELRSPLATLTTGLEIAVADPTGATWAETAGMLQTQTQRMSYLVEDLLTLAKIDDAGLRFVMGDVDLDDVLQDEINRLRTVSRHTITARITPARITGDPNRLAQVVRNLLNNAERHAATTIGITLTTAAGTAHLSVDNDGDTIPQAERERVFDRFVRLDASRTRESGGSGLGLAISREILRSHSGTIAAGESPEGLTRFHITLRLQETVTAPHASLTPASHTARGSNDGQL
ncbi:signal transduction histidine kinase [Arthrobacter sp. CAN_A6]|uniref:sensor histidine kinase n=1 Tax=Arthrobacter sp. CAN_A6 TaxID=2787721 RepID=UPI0018CBC8C4